MRKNTDLRLQRETVLFTKTRFRQLSIERKYFRCRPLPLLLSACTFYFVAAAMMTAIVQLGQQEAVKTPSTLSSQSSLTTPLLLVAIRSIYM
eukprot:COSAG06_NODE_895_length_11669_cov_5.131384_18_plen_92_part_00